MLYNDLVPHNGCSQNDTLNEGQRFYYAYRTNFNLSKVPTIVETLHLLRLKMMLQKWIMK